MSKENYYYDEKGNRYHVGEDSEGKDYLYTLNDDGSRNYIGKKPGYPEQTSGSSSAKAGHPPIDDEENVVPAESENDDRDWSDVQYRNAQTLIDNRNRLLGQSRKNMKLSQQSMKDQQQMLLTFLEKDKGYSTITINGKEYIDWGESMKKTSRIPSTGEIDYATVKIDGKKFIDMNETMRKLGLETFDIKQRMRKLGYDPELINAQDAKIILIDENKLSDDPNADIKTILDYHNREFKKKTQRHRDLQRGRDAAHSLRELLGKHLTDHNESIRQEHRDKMFFKVSGDKDERQQFIDKLNEFLKKEWGYNGDGLVVKKEDIGDNANTSEFAKDALNNDHVYLDVKKLLARPEVGLNVKDQNGKLQRVPLGRDAIEAGLDKAGFKRAGPKLKFEDRLKVFTQFREAYDAKQGNQHLSDFGKRLVDEKELLKYLAAENEVLEFLIETAPAWVEKKGKQFMNWVRGGEGEKGKAWVDLLFGVTTLLSWSYLMSKLDKKTPKLVDKGQAISIKHIKDASGNSFARYEVDMKKFLDKVKGSDIKWLKDVVSEVTNYMNFQGKVGFTVGDDWKFKDLQADIAANHTFKWFGDEQTISLSREEMKSTKIDGGRKIQDINLLKFIEEIDQLNQPDNSANMMDTTDREQIHGANLRYKKKFDSSVQAAISGDFKHSIRKVHNAKTKEFEQRYNYGKSVGTTFELNNEPLRNSAKKGEGLYSMKINATYDIEKDKTAVDANIKIEHHKEDVTNIDANYNPDLDSIERVSYKRTMHFDEDHSMTYLQSMNLNSEEKMSAYSNLAFTKKFGKKFSVTPNLGLGLDESKNVLTSAGLNVSYEDDNWKVTPHVGFRAKGESWSSWNVRNKIEYKWNDQKNRVFFDFDHQFNKGKRDNTNSNFGMSYGW